MGQGEFVVQTFGVVGFSDTMAAGTRGIIGSLGRAVGVNLNSAGSTTIVSFPSSGIQRAVVLRVIRDNDSGANTTASVQFGLAGGSDWRTTATVAGAATGVYTELLGTPASPPVYSVGQVFQVTVTIVQGSAATADFRAIGYYE